MDEITSVKYIMDGDETVAMFEVNKTSEVQNEPWWFVINYEGNDDLLPVHEWLLQNGQPIPNYSSLIIEE
jgi:hypothetical protein